MLRGLVAVVEGRIFFLEVAGVRKEYSAKVDGRRRRIDRAVEALLYQTRYPTGVIEVGMRQDDGIDLSCLNRQVLPVALAPFLLPLKQSAIDQNLNATP